IFFVVERNTQNLIVIRQTLFVSSVVSDFRHQGRTTRKSIFETHDHASWCSFLACDLECTFIRHRSASPKPTVLDPAFSSCKAHNLFKQASVFTIGLQVSLVDDVRKSPTNCRSHNAGMSVTKEMNSNPVDQIEFHASIFEFNIGTATGTCTNVLIVQ